MGDDTIELANGAVAAVRGSASPSLVVVGFGGGSPRPAPLADSPSLRWLLSRLGGALPDAAVWEVRYRLASWHDLDGCIDDGRAAVDAAAAAGRPMVLVGFSMGGAVASGAAAHPAIGLVVAASPWIPPELSIDGLAGRRVRVVHGAIDGWLPGIPGVPPRHSLAAVERMRAAGVDATHRVVRGAVHPFALRGPGDRLIPAPGAGRRADLVTAECAAERERVTASDPAPPGR